MYEYFIQLMQGAPVVSDELSYIAYFFFSLTIGGAFMRLVYSMFHKW